MDKEWVLNIKQQCEENDVAFFFKQWGTWGADKVKRNKKSNGKELDGKIWQQFPEAIEEHFPDLYPSKLVRSYVFNNQYNNLKKTLKIPH